MASENINKGRVMLPFAIDENLYLASVVDLRGDWVRVASKSE